jgi:hypothetical protein
MQDINPPSIVSRGLDEMTLTLAPCTDRRERAPHTTSFPYLVPPNSLLREIATPLLEDVIPLALKVPVMPRLIGF